MKRIFLALAAGSLLTLALPPFYILPVMLLSFPFLLHLMGRCDNGRQAFAVGWCFGFAHHVTGLYWVCYSLLVDAERFAWMIPFAISLIPAYLALYTGLVGWLTWCSRLEGWQRAVLFASLWTLAELARAIAFTGFPWNAIGYSWAGLNQVEPVAALVGVYGLSLLTVLLAAMAGVMRTHTRAFVITVLGCTAWVAAGYMLHNPPVPEGTFKVRIVQPNIKQEMKWDEAYMMEALARHVELSRVPYEDEPPAVVIWPESALPFRLEEDASLRHYIAGYLPPSSLLITGGVRQEGGKVYNALFVMNQQAEIIAHYHKHHLVPFGEYVPLRKFLPFVERITQGGMDFSSGEGAQTLKVDNLPPFSPLICYEGIFSGEVAERENPPAWLVNITNDAWFGDSTGPYQHFAMARMRAWEEGIPLVRVANTGISGTSFDVDLLGLNEAGFKDVLIPYSTKDSLGTWYGKWGKLLPLLLCTILLLALWFRSCATKDRVSGLTCKTKD